MAKHNFGKYPSGAFCNDEKKTVVESFLNDNMTPYRISIVYDICIGAVEKIIKNDPVCKQVHINQLAEKKLELTPWNDDNDEIGMMI